MGRGRGVAVVAAAVTRVLMRLLPMPVIAAPFILTFWCFWPVAERFGLARLEFPPFIDERAHYVMASLSAALGATPFAGTVTTGVLFLAGVLVSNWRHAAVAFVAANLAT